jgi:hypothetical protein
MQGLDFPPWNAAGGVLLPLTTSQRAKRAFGGHSHVFGLPLLAFGSAWADAAAIGAARAPVRPAWGEPALALFAGGPVRGFVVATARTDPSDGARLRLPALLPLVNAVFDPASPAPSARSDRGRVSPRGPVPRRHAG